MIRQAAGERCYHMFYQMLAGAPQEMLSTSVCVSVCLFVCGISVDVLYVCVSLSVCLPLYVCACIYIYVCMYNWCF